MELRSLQIIFNRKSAFQNTMTQVKDLQKTENNFSNFDNVIVNENDPSVYQVSLKIVKAVAVPEPMDEEFPTSPIASKVTNPTPVKTQTIKKQRKEGLNKSGNSNDAPQRKAKLPSKKLNQAEKLRGRRDREQNNRKLVIKNENGVVASGYFGKVFGSPLSNLSLTPLQSKPLKSGGNTQQPTTPFPSLNMLNYRTIHFDPSSYITAVSFQVEGPYQEELLVPLSRTRNHTKVDNGWEDLINYLENKNMHHILESVNIYFQNAAYRFKLKDSRHNLTALVKTIEAEVRVYKGLEGFYEHHSSTQVPKLITSKTEMACLKALKGAGLRRREHINCDAA